jgi:hypothetical protein
MPNMQHTAIHQVGCMENLHLLYKEKAPTDLLEIKRYTTLSNTIRSPAQVRPNPDGSDAKSRGESTEDAQGNN